MPKHITSFKPLSVDEELSLLKKDNAEFSATSKYIEALIDAVFVKLKVPPKRSVKLLSELLSQIPVAAQRYLDGIQKRGRSPYRFSTYFTWYIKRSLETNRE